MSSSRNFDYAIAIGGAAGQGIATPGNLLSRIFIRRGLHLNAYNAYQSIIRGGHIFLTIRVSDAPVTNHGDKLDLLLCLNQDTMDRHRGLMGPGTHVLFNSDAIEPGEATSDGARLCPLPIKELTDDNRNKLVQNTVAVGAIVRLMGFEFDVLEEVLKQQFQRKGQAVVDENVAVARAGYEHAVANFGQRFGDPGAAAASKPQAVWTGNEALGMGGAAAGVKFYCAYPMSPSTGVLHWMAKNARELGIMVRQMEDEIAVANVAIGAAHTGVRSMCATSGGGFALMTEAIGAAGDDGDPTWSTSTCMRAGPSTGVPTKTEQGDLWQMLGASPRRLPAVHRGSVRDALDAFQYHSRDLQPLSTAAQCPGIVLSDLLISEGTFSVPPETRSTCRPAIDRGELITEGKPDADGGLADPGTREGGGYQNTYDDHLPAACLHAPCWGSKALSMSSRRTSTTRMAC